MTIIIGLGNPGKKFENTRHNVGFMVIDEYAKKNNFPAFELQKKSNAFICEKDDTLLVKPQTFMNDSGKSVQALAKNYSNPLLVVIHDDIDLPIGKIKIVKERGSAGHKGVESIIEAIGNEGLVRFRVGIGAENKTEALKIVLKKFSPDEQKIINTMLEKITFAIDLFIKEGLDVAMNKFNQ